MKQSLLATLPVGLILVVTGGPTYATDYRFTVTCQDRAFVMEWRTGDIDPGKEYLRVATGTKNPNCSVSDYSERDASLPKETVEGWAAIGTGFPPITIICGIFGC